MNRYNPPPMRLCATFALAALAACGPHRGYAPPPGDSMETQHVPSEEMQFKSMTLLPEDVAAVAAYQKQFGWRISHTEPSHAQSPRVLVTFERPRRP